MKTHIANQHLQVVHLAILTFKMRIKLAEVKGEEFFC